MDADGVQEQQHLQQPVGASIIGYDELEEQGMFMHEPAWKMQASMPLCAANIMQHGKCAANIMQHGICAANIMQLCAKPCMQECAQQCAKPCMH